jgi:hypothetical protein
MTALDTPIAFTCPRCGNAVEARFYGPCDPCREALGTLRGDGQGEVQAERFVPKMNVVPNQIATKD